MKASRWLWGWLLLLVLCVAAPAVLGDSNVYLLTDFLITALFAMAYNLMLGQAGLLSFGHAAFYGLGAYTLGLLQARFGLPLGVCMLAAPVVSGAAALLMGVFTIRLSGMYFAMLTLAFSQLIFTLMDSWYSVTGGDNGLTVTVPDVLLDTAAFYYFTLAIVTVCIVLLRLMVGSPFGAALAAIRENPRRAVFIGLNVRSYQLAAFVLSGALTGVAGALRGLLQQMAFPSLLYWTQSADPVLMTLAGGLHSFAGPVVGAALFVFLNFVVASYANYPLLVFGGVVLVLVLFLPEGIVGTLARRRRPPAMAATSLPPVVLEPAATSPAHRTGGPALELIEVSKLFDGFRAVDGMSITVQAGEIHALIGPNGAGKSTLLNLASGALAPNGGEIRYLGRSIVGLAPHRLCHAGIARSFQITSIFPRLTVAENVRIALLARRGMTRRFLVGAHRLLVGDVARLLAQVHMAGTGERIAGELAAGDRKRLEFAMALAGEPQVMLLDEPTAGMSPSEREVVTEVLRDINLRHGVAVLFTEHDIDMVFSLADRITVMHQGAPVATGLPGDVRASRDVQDVYLGEHEDLGEHENA